MTHLETELEYLNELTIEMMELVKSQLEKTKAALLENNHDLAEEIVRTELRVNALELNIEKECENIIALFQPVATNLRFILAVFKSVSEIERIGDHADGMAKFLLDRPGAIDMDIIKAVKVEEMFDATILMFDDVITSLIDQDAGMARKLYKKDKEINKDFKRSVKIIGDEISKSHPKGNDLLTIYSVLARLERTGDLLTNVAEEIIFYLEAEILKHKKKNKKIRKRIGQE